MWKGFDALHQASLSIFRFLPGDIDFNKVHKNVLYRLV